MTNAEAILMMAREAADRRQITFDEKEKGVYADGIYIPLSRLRYNGRLQFFDRSMNPRVQCEVYGQQ